MQQVRTRIRWAIGLAFYQIVIFYLVTGGKIHQMIHWDIKWYRDIAADGYSVSFPLKHDVYGGDNISFFPAFPVWVRFFIHTFGMNSDWAVYVAAQIACAVAWFYFLGLLDQLNVRKSLIGIVCLMFLIQPGAFYHVIGYSESLFSAMLLGFVYWTHRALDWRAKEGEGKIQTLPLLMAIAHGGVLSCTRILGVALCGYPVLLLIARSLREKRFLTRPFLLALLMSGLGLWGFVSYLLYCQLRWGSWTLYWDANRVGWNVYFDPWRLLRWSYYRDEYFFGNLSEVLGRQFTLVTGLISLALTRWSYRFLKESPVPFALALLNLGFMIETVVGSHGMHSMIRYLVPINCIFIPLWATRWEQRLRTPGYEFPQKRWITVAACGVLLFALQIMFAIRFSRSDWVS